MENNNQEISQEHLDGLAANFEMTDEEKKMGLGLGQTISKRAMNEINAILVKYGCLLTITNVEIGTILNVGKLKE